MRTLPEIEQRLANDPDGCPRQPYWDPTLRRNKQLRLDFIKRLFDIGIISFRRRIKAKVGLFFVKKKDGMIRLVVDARIPNFMHHSPPVTRLGSAACYVDLDLSSERLQTGFGEIGAFSGSEPFDVGSPAYANEADVSDCFYQFIIEELGSSFGIDEPLAVSELKSLGIHVDRVFDDDFQSYTSVQNSDILYPCISGMSMGWSWALFFANEAVAHTVKESSPSQVAEFRERLPVPQLSDHSTITGTYVDNVSIVGRLSADVEARCVDIKSQKPIDVPAGKGEIQSSFFLIFMFYLFWGGGLAFYYYLSKILVLW